MVRKEMAICERGSERKEKKLSRSLPKHLGMKAVGTDRENILTTFIFIFLFGNGYRNGRLGRENEIECTGNRNRNNSIGSMSITVGKQYLKAGTSSV